MESQSHLINNKLIDSLRDLGSPAVVELEPTTPSSRMQAGMKIARVYKLIYRRGTGSARAALVSPTGQLLASSTQATTTWRSDTDARIFEQSTTEIWKQICIATRECLATAKVSPSDVAGIGFDATCSLAVTNRQGEPVCVTGGKELGGTGERNIVLWADHRAEEEAGIINSSGAVVLDYVGGTMSVGPLLTYKSTGSQARSTCSLTCKCSFVPPGATEAAHGWVPEFFRKIGLGSLVDDGFAALGGWGVTAPSDKNAGQPVGHGLTKQAAEELGLVEGTPVGSAVIDAYAGWIGTVAARYKTKSGEELSPAPGLEASGERLAAVAGTSTCHVIQVCCDAVVMECTIDMYAGVNDFGQNAVFPGWWMNEGGQSSTGQLIDFVLTTHAAYPRLQALAKEQQKSVHVVLAEKLEALRLEAGADSLVELTKDVHFYPDLHGNRSPLADPQMRGSIVGLKLDSGLGDLALKFNVTLEAYRRDYECAWTYCSVDLHVWWTGCEYQVDAIVSVKVFDILLDEMISKKLAQKECLRLFCRFADTIGVPVILPQSHSAAVVLGAAMLGRFAAEVVAMGRGMRAVARDAAARPVTNQIGQSESGSDRQSYAGQKVAEEASEKTKEDLWKIMRSVVAGSHNRTAVPERTMASVVSDQAQAYSRRILFQVEMTPPGTEVHPKASPKESKLLDAKYSIFLEAIDIQRRWRREMAAAGQ
ncbi:ribitol kinase [Rhizoctonia solani AG-1 IA]|uniref:Ribitol kinase n=1 Tax=Thanatephorus cucumeris (strain AG1-IA) TaxID=983506 RepID=L8X1E6_THACA|nr:ribitol kinase [Rhizoctonia solani AG-1 IA]